VLFGIVGFLLKVDDAVPLELDQAVGFRFLAGADVVGGEGGGVVVPEVIEEVRNREADQVVAGDDQEIVVDVLAVDQLRERPRRRRTCRLRSSPSTESRGLSNSLSARWASKSGAKRWLVLT